MWEPEPYVLDLSDVIRLSEEDLLRICAANPDLQIEQNAAGQLEIMSPAGPSSSAGAAKLNPDSIFHPRSARALPVALLWPRGFRFGPAPG